MTSDAPHDVPGVPAGTEWLRLTPGQREVILVLAERDGTTIKQLEDRLIKSSGTLRATLRQLTRMRLIQVEHLPGQVGRPAHLYRLAPQAWALFPSNVRAVAQELIRFLEASHPDVLAEFVSHARAGLEARGYALLEGTTFANHEEAAFELYRELGFVPAWAEVGGMRCVALNHCPYWPVASLTETICEAERTAISAFLGQDVQFVGHRRRGDSRCIVCWNAGARANSNGQAEQ